LKRDKLPALTEREFSLQVEGLFKLFGWRYAHFRPAQTNKGWRTPMTGTKGFPDYVAVRVRDGKRQIIFAELKSEKGKISTEQDDWLTELGGYLWRPSMLEEISEKLR